MTVFADPADPGAGPLCLGAGALSASLNRNGSLRLLRSGDLTLNLFPGNEAEGGPANLVLRRWDGGVPVATLPLCGPESPLRWCETVAAVAARGGAAPDLHRTRPPARRWREATLSAAGWPALRLRLELLLAASAPAWFWHLAIDHLSTPATTPAATPAATSATGRAAKPARWTSSTCRTWLSRPGMRCA